jgi:hypothetical protein
MSNIATRSDIERLESAILQGPQVDLNTDQIVNGKVAARTIRIPAGTVLTGAVHNKDSVNIVCGDITVTTDNGPQRFIGYHVLPSLAGTKRAGVAHEDTVWTTLWHTELTDQAAIEDEMTDDSTRLQNRQAALPNITLEALEN